MNKIEKVSAKEIFDSRGNPTLEVSVTAGCKTGVFLVPSGASTGVHEAVELRDGDKNYYNGRGVFNAIKKVNEVIAPVLIGHDVTDQSGLDKIMIDLDGTDNKASLGANSIIGVSVACLRAAAMVKDLETYAYLRKLKDIKPSRSVPYLYMNLINGGMHAANNLAFQEYHIVPIVDDVFEAIDIGIRTQNTLRELIADKFGGGAVVMGDEGGFAPKVADIKVPLQLLREALSKNNFTDKVRLALDVAASSFYENGTYKISGKDVSAEELMNIYMSLVKEFHFISIEDPFNEEDFENFRKLKDMASGLLVVGDDLTTTNPLRLKEAISKGSINAMIVKPNQIGTVSETLDAMKEARDNGVEIIVSHRSGETMDNFVADLAYAFGCFGLKAGAPLKEERIVKYNRLAKISRQ